MKLKLIILSILLSFFVTSCGTVKKAKLQSTTEIETQRKKDSLYNVKIEIYEKQVQTLKTENEKLSVALKEKTISEKESETEVKLKPEIDPNTGKFKESIYTETENGKPTKTISITGNGEVIVKTKSNTKSELEKSETKEKANTLSILTSEKIADLEKKLAVSINENFKLKAQKLEKQKTVEKSYHLFWWGFFIGIGSIAIIYFGLKYLNKKFNILAYLNKTKLS